MSKCFECIKKEYYDRIKWNEIKDAVVIFDGKGYCYEHLIKEIGWKEKQGEEK